VETVALEGVKLVDIEFKRHDPHKIVENHLDQFNMKIYVHENSLYEEILRGVRSYEEVHNIFQNLPPDQQVGFLSFQRHRGNSLPKVLQGESIVTPPAQESMPTGSEPEHSSKHKVEKTSKSSKVLTQELEASLSGQLIPQALAQLKAYLKQRVEGNVEKCMANFPYLGWHVFITRFWSLQSGGCGSGRCQIC
jgi:hypothetical protein